MKKEFKSLWRKFISVLTLVGILVSSLPIFPMTASAVTLLQGNLAYSGQPTNSTVTSVVGTYTTSVNNITIVSPTTSRLFGSAVNASNPIAKITDGSTAGNSNNQWANAGTTSAADCASGAIVIDLGISKNFNRVKLLRYGSADRGTAFTYQIHYSNTKPSKLSDLTDDPSKYPVMTTGSVAQNTDTTVWKTELDFSQSVNNNSQYVIINVLSITRINSYYNFALGEVEVYSDAAASNVTVSYDANYTGASAIAAATKKAGQIYGITADGTAAETLPIPTRTGFDFLGWYTDAACTGTPIGNNTAIMNGNAHTLYAKWGTVTQLSNSVIKSLNIIQHDQTYCYYGSGGMKYSNSNDSATFNYPVAYSKNAYDGDNSTFFGANAPSNIKVQVLCPLIELNQLPNGTYPTITKAVISMQYVTGNGNISMGPQAGNTIPKINTSKDFIGPKATDAAMKASFNNTTGWTDVTFNFASPVSSKYLKFRQDAGSGNVGPTLYIREIKLYGIPSGTVTGISPVLTSGVNVDTTNKFIYVPNSLTTSTSITGALQSSWNGVASTNSPSASTFASGNLLDTVSKINVYSSATTVPYTVRTNVAQGITPVFSGVDQTTIRYAAAATDGIDDTSAGCWNSGTTDYSLLANNGNTEYLYVDFGDGTEQYIDTVKFIGRNLYSGNGSVNYTFSYCPVEKDPAISTNYITINTATATTALDYGLTTFTSTTLSTPVLARAVKYSMTNNSTANMNMNINEFSAYSTVHNDIVLDGVKYYTVADGVESASSVNSITVGQKVRAKLSGTNFAAGNNTYTLLLALYKVTGTGESAVRELVDVSNFTDAISVNTLVKFNNSVTSNIIVPNDGTYEARAFVVDSIDSLIPLRSMITLQ